MTITKESITRQIKEIDQQTGNILADLKSKDSQIRDLELQNETLQQDYQKIKAEIEEYIKELKQIREHYVNSNNNAG